MSKPRSFIPSVSGGEVLNSIAREVVRLAADAEGLEAWLKNHAGSLTVPGQATRNYAHSLFGDTDDAVLFNTLLVLQVERCRQDRLATPA